MKEDQYVQFNVDSTIEDVFSDTSSDTRRRRISKREKVGIEEEKFNIGLCIKGVLAEEGRSVSWLANQMGCTREYLYKVFTHQFHQIFQKVFISNFTPYFQAPISKAAPPEWSCRPFPKQFPRP